MLPPACDEVPEAARVAPEAVVVFCVFFCVLHFF
jgi:hypothetical protein